MLELETPFFGSSGENCGTFVRKRLKVGENEEKVVKTRELFLIKEIVRKFEPETSIELIDK